MNTVSCDIASLKAGVATDTQGEEMVLVVQKSSNNGISRETKKSTYGIKWAPPEYKNKAPRYPSHYQIVWEGLFTRNQASNPFGGRFG